MSKRRRYWIRFHIAPCQVCGGECDGRRERVYGPKPKAHAKRYVVSHGQNYCGCMNAGLL